MKSSIDLHANIKVKTNVRDAMVHLLKKLIETTVGRVIV
jgi:hypothetical protein